MGANWILRLAATTAILVVAGFAVTGLSRLVVTTPTARRLGAPLLFAGFLTAVATFALALWRAVVRRLESD